jgi:hypothetical protein
MPAPFSRQIGLIAVVVATLIAATPLLRADEIKLKDGQILYGVIVAYEDNMFKVKTDYGFVLVEKDKIASIVPTNANKPPAKPDSKKPAKPEPAPAAPSNSAATSRPSSNPSPSPAATSSKLPASPTPQPVSAEKPVEGTQKPNSAKPAPSVSTATSSAAASPATKPAPEKSSAPTPAAQSVDKSKIVSAPTNATTAAPAAKNPSTRTAAPLAPKSTTSNVPVVTPVPPPAKPKEPEPPVNREALQGNTYINYTHGFKMYKPPSWQLIEDARTALPNAIVAMGTTNESTLMVVGEEKTKNSLEVTAADVEKRLRDTYGNYRRISQRKTVVSGFPAIEIRYRGLADDHDWSGTLLVVSRSGDTFSILGMTYADTDLIQIQENVIARSIASLEFNSN